jgi:hypothetical protein
MAEERQTMALYEHIFMSRQDITPQQVDELVGTYKGIIEAHRELGPALPHLPDQKEPQGLLLADGHHGACRRRH